MSKKIGYEEKRKAMQRLCTANFDRRVFDSGTFFTREYNDEMYDVFGGKYMGLAWKCCPFEYGGSGEFCKARDKDVEVVFRCIVESASNSQNLIIPTVKEIKAFLKDYREEHRGGRGIPEPIYDFGDGKPMVNAKWLKDILVVLSDYDDEIMWGSFKNTKTPIYIEKEDESSCAILLPIRKPDTSKT